MAPQYSRQLYGSSYTGMTSVVTPVDLKVVDIIGWNRAPATANDFNGDAISGVPLQNGQQLAIWEMNGTTIQAGSGNIGASGAAGR